MSAQSESQASSMDGIKWVLVLAILAAAVVGNYYYSELSVLIRAVAVVASVAVAALIAIQTEKGRNAVAFAKEARVEVRKVVWPTRQETINTTLIVFAAVIVMSLILWGLDSILVSVVSFVTQMEF